MNRNDGGPAFPFRVRQEFPDGTVAHGVNEGMTLRDYFAAKAMAAQANERVGDSITRHMNESDAVSRARAAYEFADAMLARRDA